MDWQQLRTWLLFLIPEAVCRKDPWENLTWAGNHDDAAVASIEPSLDLCKGGSDESTQRHKCP